MSYLALRQRDRDAVDPVPPVLGAAGTALVFPLMVWYLARREPGTLLTVAVVAVAVVSAEVPYFEHETIEREVVAVERAALGDDESIPPGPE